MVTGVVISSRLTTKDIDETVLFNETNLPSISRKGDQLPHFIFSFFLAIDFTENKYSIN